MQRFKGILNVVVVIPRVSFYYEVGVRVRRLRRVVNSGFLEIRLEKL